VYDLTDAGADEDEEDEEGDEDTELQRAISLSLR
jgi:hypothetical protein